LGDPRRQLGHPRREAAKGAPQTGQFNRMITRAQICHHRLFVFSPARGTADIGSKHVASRFFCKQHCGGRVDNGQTSGLHLASTLTHVLGILVLPALFGLKIWNLINCSMKPPISNVSTKICMNTILCYRQTIIALSTSHNTMDGDLLIEGKKKLNG